MIKSDKSLQEIIAMRPGGEGVLTPDNPMKTSSVLYPDFSFT
jgi:hypothetical protein